MTSNPNRLEEERGMANVELWRRNPELLPRLLGNFYDTSLRGVLLRRLLLAMHVSPRWLEIIGQAIVNPSLQEKWFTFLKQYCFWRGVRRSIKDRHTWNKLTQGIPILMYHAFCVNDEHPSRYIHTIQRFKTQMRLLKLLGYRIISLEHYLECLSKGDLSEEHSIIITIDDGYWDNSIIAYPVLKRLHIPVTIFLVSGYLGKTNDWDKDNLLTGRGLFNAEQARKMQDGLITFGAHTHTHPWLRNIPEDQARDEIVTSKKELERELGSPIRVFSYPHGDYDELTVKLVEEAGFLGACTTQNGLNTPGGFRFALHRTEIFGTCSIFRFLIAIYSGK